MARLTGPLDGVKVLELCQVMAGPTCGMLLADLGADVVKVEKLPGGDDTRTYDKPNVNGESAAFLAMNRNKRSIALDLKQRVGQEALKRLVRDADVLVENFRKGTMEKFGLGYETLKAINPRLVYCAITGFGHSGPYADKGGFDLVAQGYSGLMSITGEPGREPVKCGPPVCDINGGMLGALGIVAAYVHRLKTGEGQMVDTSLLEAGIHTTFWHSAIFLATGVSPEPTGSGHVLSAPYQAFPTRDGWVTIGGANPANWSRLARMMALPELLEDPRFKTNSDRMQHRAELIEILSAKTRQRTTEELVTALDAAGIPAGPVNTIGEMLADPHVLAREMVVETVHPRAGPTKGLGVPIKFTATPGGVRRPAPLLGEHTRAVLREAGYADAEIDVLASTGAALAP
ncbi:MAG: CoA transferase [Gammaproteobacteria bacterium]|nr:CoA transferase [Gammaproteobacteria bacterium]